MIKKTILSLAAMLVAVNTASVHAAGRVTIDSLLHQMVDLSALAEYPDPPFTTGQFSSYDRASETPKDHDNWFANYDRGFMLYDGVVREKTPYFTTGPMEGRKADGFFVAGARVGIAPNHKRIGSYVWAYKTGADGRPIEGKIPQGYVAESAITMDPQGHVLAEMDGPGCVVRIWSADPKDAGNVRVYLDGNKEPAIEAPLETLLAGKWQIERKGKRWIPFPDPIACERSRGLNLYFPIAYAKHCKICTDRPDFYYHVNYRTYPHETEITTFRLDDLTDTREKIDQVAAGLSQPPSPANQARTFLTTTADLEPGDTTNLLLVDGPGAINRIEVTVHVKESLEEALRGLILVGNFDNAGKPQIWCPLGDFFGTSPGANKYWSLPFTVSSADPGKSREAVLTSYWFMPFEKSARLLIQNLGRKTASTELSVQRLAGNYRWSEGSMHFHAKWRSETMKTRPFRDWNFCAIDGKGVFVGDMLSIMNPVGAWWGEGDEKIYIDGTSFPDHFGTGTEDYFGYAWSSPEPFQHAYHNQTRCDGPANFGRTSVNRFHILDRIPFTKSLRFDMEFWHWTANVDVNYASTCYWYGRPGTKDNFHPVGATVLQKIPAPPPPFRIPGAIEGESLKILGQSEPFDLGPQDLTEFSDGKWSGNSHLWGRPTKEGEWADLGIPVSLEGKYRILVYLTRARDYGIVQFEVNGKPLGKPIDGFAPDKVLASGAIDLGTVFLKKGQAKLRVTAVGTNEHSVGVRYMWGLDCVVLKAEPGGEAK